MEKIQYKRRFFKGLFVALRILLSYRLAAAVRVFLAGEQYSQHLKNLHRKNAKLIREKALEMKGVMIKVGQFLSSRIDFLPDEYIQELSQLQDQVPPHDYGEIRKQITDAFGKAPEELFLSFNPEPIAAASLGQVHSATLRDNRHVAVKVRYPEIEKIIETDIRMFGLLVRILRGRYGKINLDILHEEFSKIVRAELDYLQEGRSAEKFLRNFLDDEKVIIPAVVWDFTREKVLTLEFVGGTKITECSPAKTPHLDCGEIVSLLARTYSKMIFLHGFFHGDPHPGNIFVLEGPKLVFVDFGMVQAIPDRIKKELRAFANAIVDKNTSGIIDSLEKMGFIIEGADYSALTDVAESLVEKYRYITPEELKSLTVDDIAKEIEKIIDIIEYIQIPNNFILLGRTIGILNGIAYRLNPEVNIIEIGKPYIKEFLRGTGREQRRQVLDDLQEKILDLWRLPAQVSSLLTKAHRGELSFRLAKSEMQEITGQFRAMTNVMMLVILTVTTAAASLFLFLLGLKTLSAASAGAAVVLGLLSVFRLTRD